jgi:hypothetical protein
LSEAQAITATANSTNVIDLEDVRDLGEGAPLFIHTQVVTADFTDADNNSTLTITGVVADNTGLSTNAQEIVLAPAFTHAALTLYSQFFFPLRAYRNGEDFTLYAHDGTPTSVLNGRRYFGLKYTVDNGNFSTGAVTSKLTLDQSTTPRVYPASTST